MPVIVTEVPVNSLVRDESKAKETPYVFDHLKYYCSKFMPLPAVIARLKDGKAEVLGAGVYLDIAKALGHKTIRVSFREKSEAKEIKDFLRDCNGNLLCLSNIEAEETEQDCFFGWHIFFFERVPSSKEKQGFVDTVVTAFSTLGEKYGIGPRVSEVLFLDDQKSAEFQANIPTKSERWYLDVREAIHEYSEGCVKIVSYQGFKL